jgi:hypothetical protein
MTTDINPCIVDGEPTCSGEECPAQVLSNGFFICSIQSEPKIDGKSRTVALANAGHLCIPGLRRLLAEAREERDAANKRADDLHEKNKEAVAALVAHSENETRLLNASIQACAERDKERADKDAARYQAAQVPQLRTRIEQLKAERERVVAYCQTIVDGHASEIGLALAIVEGYGATGYAPAPSGAEEGKQ